MTPPSLSRGATPMTGSVVRGCPGIAVLMQETRTNARSVALRQRIAERLRGDPVAPIVVMPEVRVHVLPGRPHRLQSLGPGRDRRLVVALARTQTDVREIRGLA